MAAGRILEQRGVARMTQEELKDLENLLNEFIKAENYDIIISLNLKRKYGEYPARVEAKMVFPGGREGRADTVTYAGCSLVSND